MNTFAIYSVLVLAALAIEISVFLKSKISTPSKFELAALTTILIYRISTLIYLMLGFSFAYKASLKVDFLDHSWLGIFILIYIFAFWPKKKLANLRPVLMGLGAGMFIDEISEVISSLGFPLPSHFRDTMADFLLIMATYLLLLVIRRSRRQ